MTTKTVSNFREELAETPIPYLIDLVDYQRVSEAFKRVIRQSAISW